MCQLFYLAIKACGMALAVYEKLSGNDGQFLGRITSIRPFSQKGPAQIIFHLCEALHLATKVTKVLTASTSNIGNAITSI